MDRFTSRRRAAAFGSENTSVDAARGDACATWHRQFWGETTLKTVDLTGEVNLCADLHFL